MEDPLKQLVILLATPQRKPKYFCLFYKKSNRNCFNRNQYWLIYVLPKAPKVNNKPADTFLASVGIDGLVVQNDFHYLFWFKTITISTP